LLVVEVLELVKVQVLEELVVTENLQERLQDHIQFHL
tara:strand:+ start:108 stop:218 length:111 start_codon:yes stop_codon:yes gene_type:complete